MAGGGEQAGGLRAGPQGQDGTGVAGQRGLGQLRAGTGREGVEAKLAVAGGR
jgi:hypothetical protein